MSTITPNLGLYKPDPSDSFGEFRAKFNDNMDILDNGGGSGGHTIIDPNGTDMTQRTGLQFTGNVSVSDDGVNDKTVVDILGGSNLILDAQIYSTEEKQVGVWTDKKPLYRKTIFNVAPNTVLMTNVDTFVNAEIKYEGLSPDDDYKGFGDGFTVYSSFTFTETGGVITYVPWSYSTDYTKKTADYITIWYTKTTDTAGSGGYQAYGFSPVIYSDVERVIGVWRNNKPLYQKTLILRENGVDLYTYSGYSYLNCLPSDIEFINIVQMLMPRSGGGVGYVDVRNNYNEVRVVPNISNQSIYLYDSHNPTDTIVTIQYTKTTDVAGSGDYNTYGVPTAHYSTSEQVIGTYLGKPLYQRTWDFVSTNIINANTWTNLFSNDIDIDKVTMNETLDDEGRSNKVAYCGVRNGYVAVYSTFATNIQTITLRYTKTTD